MMKKELIGCFLNMEFYCKSKLELSHVLKNILDIIGCDVKNDEVVLCDVDTWNSSCIYSQYGKEWDWYLCVFSGEVDTTDPDDVKKKLKRYKVEGNDLSCLIEPVWRKLELSVDDISSIIVKLGYDRVVKDVYITFYYCTSEEDNGGL